MMDTARLYFRRSTNLWTKDRKFLLEYVNGIQPPLLRVFISAPAIISAEIISGFLLNAAASVK